MKPANMTFALPAMFPLIAANLEARQYSYNEYPDVSNALQNILSNTHGSDLYTYPTDLTRGIVPVSHPIPVHDN